MDAVSWLLAAGIVSLPVTLLLHWLLFRKLNKSRPTGHN